MQLIMFRKIFGNRIKQKFNDNNKQLLIITSKTNWCEPPRNRHFVAQQMSRFFNVIYFQIYPQSLSKCNDIKVNDSLIVIQSIIYIKGLNYIFKYLPIIKHFYHKKIVNHFENIIKIMGYKNADLINFQHDFYQIYNSELIKKKVYFCGDDFINQNPNKTLKERRKTEESQQKVVKRSDIVIAVSKPIAEQLESDAKKVEVVLSAHNFPKKVNILPCSGGSKFPINVCYMGFLDHYIAIDWFEYILKDESIRLMIIGPIADLSLIDCLIKFDNFQRIKPTTGNELQELMITQDVLTIPYANKVSNMAVSSPAKLFQYLACGRPIVTSDIKNLIRMEDKFVYKAKCKEEFLEKIKKAHSEDNESLLNKRIKFASQNTWDVRGDQIYSLIK